MSSQAPSQVPLTSLYSKPCCSVTSSISSLPSPRLLRLFLSGFDLPEPDSRSRASYAILYHAHESVVAPHKMPVEMKNNPSMLNATMQTSVISENRNISSSTLSSSRRGAFLRGRPSNPVQQKTKSYKQLSDPSLFSQLDLERYNTSNPSFLRAPHVVEQVAAPHQPTLHCLPNGIHVSRTAWTKIGVTDIARKQGRDIEFARTFSLSYTGDIGHVILVALFDCTHANIAKQRLIGTAVLSLKEIFEAEGRCVKAPLSFLPMSKKDVRRSSKIPDGTLIVCGLITSASAPTYRLDVECEPIVRAKALSNSAVRRVFYTIHAILDKDRTSDIWTLIFRSNPVHMIHRKRDGGSLEYNYFSSRRLVAAPGVVFDDDISTQVGNIHARFANRMGQFLGMKHKERFFSLPGCNIRLQDPDTRLKLSLFEDKGPMADYELIADTQFTMPELQARQLGDASPIKVHANVIGKAILKYVECSADPRYFCLSLLLQNLR